MKARNPHDPYGNLEIRTVRSLEEMGSIRSIWKEMQSAEAYPAINVDIDRYISVVQASGDTMQPHVILIKEDSQPTALVVARTEEIEIKIHFGYKTLLSPQLKRLAVVYGGIITRPSEKVYSFVLD